MSELKENQTLSPEEIVNAVNAKVKETLQMAKRIYGREFEFPKIRYDLKGDTAGQATYRKWEINLNLFYLVYEHKDMIEDTIPHEIAHLVAFKVFGVFIKPHGKQWRSVMRQFGLNPKRCHSYKQEDFRRRKTRKFNYFCSCGTVSQAGSNVHKKIQNGSRHVCRKCRKRLNDCRWEEKID